MGINGPYRTLAAPAESIRGPKKAARYAISPKVR